MTTKVNRKDGGRKPASSILLEETPVLRATARLDRSASTGVWGEVLAPNGEAWLVEIHRKADGVPDHIRQTWTYTATLEAAREFAREVLREEEEEGWDV